VVSDWPETKSSGLKTALVQLLLIFYGSLRGKSAPGSQKRTPVLLGKNAGLTEGNPQLEFLWNGESCNSALGAGACPRAATTTGGMTNRVSSWRFLT